MGVARLRVDRVPGNEGDDLPAFLLYHLFALIGSQVDLAFYDDAAGNCIEVGCLEDLHQGFVGCPGSL